MVTGMYPTEKIPHWGTFTRSQVDSLVAAGVEVEVIHPKRGPVPMRYLAGALQVFMKTLSGRYDIVHGHFGLWCLAARLQWKTPVVASFLGDDLLGKPASGGGYTKKGALVVHVSRWLCHHVDAIIVKSEEMKKATRSSRENIFVIPNGVDFGLFRPIPRATARAALGWKQDGCYVLFGNDPRRPQKNYALAKAAIESLHAKGVTAELVAANGLPQTMVVQYINASNALILPSIHEGSPNIVKETMACNVAVVATNVGDVAQVTGHTTGCKVCPADPDALAEALEEAFLLSEPTTGRTDIAHLDRTVIAEQLLAVYEQIISSNLSAFRRKARVFAR
jgi:glycosyltransferase involved in cell wall biosynthesis